MSQPFFDSASPRLDETVMSGMLCAFDFDGTLAPIVKEPDRVAMPAPVLRRLIKLRDYAPVAIITGRSVTDVQRYLEFQPDFIVGNHGLEGVPGWDHHREEYSRLCESWKQALTDALKDSKRFDSAIWIEHKAYSLSVHYRMARDRARAERELTELFSALSPQAHVITGKCVFNLLPPHAPNKGLALEHLCQVSGAPSAIYVGDDVTDEDVFRLRHRELITVRIERAADSAAEFFLHHRLDMVQLLDELIKRLSVARSKHVMKAY